MPKRELLIDTRAFAPVLLESKENGKMIARGEFAVADQPTDNRRIYPAKIWEREIAKLMPQIKERKVYGEIDHPADGKTRLQNVSHLITDLQMNENGQIIGEAEIMNTGKGLDLQAIQQAGGKVGVSSRGFGSVVTNEEGMQVVQDDYQLMTFDFVALPAVETSYPKFVQEDKNLEEDDMVDKEKEKGAEEPKEIKTTEDLKEKFPKLVSAIEKEAEVFAAKKLKEQIEAELEKEKEAKLEAARTELKEQFKSELMKAVASKEEEIKRKIESEMEESRKAGDGKFAEIIEGKDREIADLKRQIAEQEEKLRVQERQVSEAVGFAKELGNHLALEKAIGESEDRKLIRTLVGDLSQYKSPEEIKTKVNVIREELEKKGASLRKERERAEEEIRRIQRSYQKQLEEMKVEVGQLREALDESLQIAKGFGTAAYVARASADRPRGSRIRDLVRKTGASSREAIDAITEEVEKEGVSEDFRRIRDKVRGREHLLNEEGIPSSGRVVMGQDLDEMRRLAGEAE